jgi:hypothetical protein
MSESKIRNEKQTEYYLYHKGVLDKLGIDAGNFTIKTAFKSNLSPLPGKNIQLFNGELKRNKDIYIELIEKVKDHNDTVVDFMPSDANRPLFVYAANPHFTSEYPVKSVVDFEGKGYDTYLVNLSELKVLWKGKKMTFAEYEKAKEEMLVPPAVEQNKTTNFFPDFEKEFTPSKEVDQSIEDVPLTEMTIRDLAAIMLIKPVSNKQWLNDLVKQIKNEL